MHALTADGYVMTTDTPPHHPSPGPGYVWLQDITSLCPGAMPWQGYPFGDDATAARVIPDAHDLTFTQFTTLFEAIISTCPPHNERMPV